MAAKRHTRRAPSGGVAKRDRGRQERYQTGGTVSWPTMGDGSGWTAAVARVTHVDRPPEEQGTIHQPELCDGAWTAVVDWDPVGRHEAVTARHPLDSLLPA